MKELIKESIDSVTIENFFKNHFTGKVRKNKFDVAGIDYIYYRIDDVKPDNPFLIMNVTLLNEDGTDMTQNEFKDTFKAYGVYLMGRNIRYSKTYHYVLNAIEINVEEFILKYFSKQIDIICRGELKVNTVKEHLNEQIKKSPISVSLASYNLDNSPYYDFTFIVYLKGRRKHLMIDFFKKLSTFVRYCGLDNKNLEWTLKHNWYQFIDGRYCHSHNEFATTKEPLLKWEKAIRLFCKKHNIDIVPYGIRHKSDTISDT